MTAQTLTHSIRKPDVAVFLLRTPSGGELVVEDDPKTVGSAPDADLTLDDRAVSRLHCEVWQTDGRLRIRDLGSKNGTWLGKSRIHDCELVPGSHVEVGRTLLEVASARREIEQIIWQGADRFGELRGAAPSMHTLYARLARIADSDLPVLLQGESGTGKELAARAVHRASRRSDGPFVVLDASALSHSLADDAIFGHEHGAFTGADHERAGAFERAHGGTLFLDEIGELPLDLQPKLLRAVERGEVQRLGGVVTRNVDVRIVSATNRSLKRMVNEGGFREDLYHRVAVATVRMPPLRDRPQDILLLALRFARSFTQDPDAIQDVRRALESHADYPWPGNVRELRGFVRRVIALGDLGAQVFAESDLGRVRSDLPYHDAKGRWIEHFERIYLEQLMDEVGGNVSEAARRAGMNRSHLSEMLKKR